MTARVGPRALRPLALSLVVLALGACGADAGDPVDTATDAEQSTTAAASTTPSASPDASDRSSPTDADEPTIVIDGPVMTLDPATVAELTADGGRIIASAGSPDERVVVVLASAVGDGAIAAELASVPEGVVNEFGGAGELLLPEDSCQFATSTLGWTVVVTDAPQATVTLPLADGSTVEQPTRAAVVGDREIGVVLAEGMLDLAGEQPRAEPGGDC